MAATLEAVAVRDKQSAQLREQAKRLLIQKRFQRAVEVCNEALKLTPGNYKVLRIRSTAWCQIGEYTKSLDADVVLKAVPYSGDAWYQKGYAHFHLKDYMAAAHAFSEGLHRNGADRTLQHGFADALTLMARIKSTPPPADSSTSPEAALPDQPGPAASNTLAALLPDLPVPDTEAPECPGDEPSTGGHHGEEAAQETGADEDAAVEVHEDGNTEAGEELPALGSTEVGQSGDGENTAGGGGDEEMEAPAEEAGVEQEGATEDEIAVAGADATDPGGDEQAAADAGGSGNEVDSEEAEEAVEGDAEA